MSAKVKNIRKIEKPRPLKTSSIEPSKILQLQNQNVEIIPQKISKMDILDELEEFYINASNHNFNNEQIQKISRICPLLKQFGSELDTTHKERLDRYFILLRNISRNEELDIVSRLKLLEVIELRAMHWNLNENVSHYYKTKIAELESTGISPSYTPFIMHSSSSTGISLAPGEILRSSGKFAKPTKIPGKNYYKDEVIIRNSDSGKVSPGTKDRLVQITGPHEDAIGHAKLLVEDTIRRNASPIKEHLDIPDLEDNFTDNFNLNKLSHSFSTGDASLGKYSIPVHFGQDVIHLSGTKVELLKTAKMVLDEYFSSQLEMQKKQDMILNQFSSSQNSNEDNIFLSKMNKIQRSSVSPFSSDDEIMREEKTNSIERNKSIRDFSRPVSIPNDYTNKNEFVLSSNKHDIYQKSISYPTGVHDNARQVFVKQISHEDLSSHLLSVEEPIPPPSSCQKKTYDREFILYCAKSPFSHCQPKDYVEIHKNYQELICEEPVMFNPDKYLKNINVEEMDSK